jgi:putative NADH-flavin reductase
MRVIIFGATGGIGKWALKHALEKGHEVTAYVRNPSKKTIEHEHLTVIKGEISDSAAMMEALKGQEAVIWCIGVNMNDKLVKDDELRGHENLLKAMKANGVRRLIDWATTSVKAEGDKWSLATILPPIIATFRYPNGKRELKAIAELVKASDTDWTIVRFLGPTDKPGTGEVKVSFGDRSLNFFIPREDIAGFMVNQLENKAFIRRMPIIGT